MMPSVLASASVINYYNKHDATSLTVDSRVVIYNRNMLITQTTGALHYHYRFVLYCKWTNSAVSKCFIAIVRHFHWPQTNTLTYRK